MSKPTEPQQVWSALGTACPKLGTSPVMLPIRYGHRYYKSDCFHDYTGLTWSTQR